MKTRPKLRQMLKNTPIVGKKADKEATLYIYDEISNSSYWGVNASDFVKEVMALGDVETIHLRINSPGGDVFAARTMQTALRQHSAKVIAHIDGLAASAATFLAMGADEIEMVEGGFFMIHNAASFIDIFGYFMAQDLDALKSEIDKEAALLAKVDDSIVSDYAKKTGKTIDQIKQWMSETTWFSAAEALENGFIDSIYEGEAVQNKWDFSGYENAPKNLTDPENKGTMQPMAVDTSALLRRLELEEQS